MKPLSGCIVNGASLTTGRRSFICRKKSILRQKETLSAVMNTVKRVSNHLTENCGYDGINLLNASDESAGQSVNHFHIHIIPRKSNDGIDAWPKFEGAKEELQTVFDKVKM